LHTQTILSYTIFWASMSWIKFNFFMACRCLLAGL